MALSLAVNKRPPATAPGGQHHRDEHEPASKEHRGEEPILPLPDPIAHYADEPQEGDCREGQQVQRHHDCLAAAPVSQPVSSGLGIARSHAAQEGKSDRQQN
jgi:hypothetical protein